MYFKKVILACLFSGLIIVSPAKSQLIDSRKEKPINEIITESLNFAESQYREMLKALPKEGEFPRSVEPDGTLRIELARSWTSGFFPGSLWYLYEYTEDEKWKKEAHRRTMMLESEKYNKNTHDLGFKLFCSFGNGYRVTGNLDYKDIIIRGSETLCTRFNPVVGSIKSWGTNQKWMFPVIIDNMMNLEMLFWASKNSTNPSFRKLSEIHANTTMKNHFRPDHSSYHVVSYDTITGLVQVKQTAQGYADESSWARGQAWGLYGFTMAYRETGNKAYLEKAKGIADFIMQHPNMPADKIPYWDFNAPDIPYAVRDASSAAIICSALLELQYYTDKDFSNKCLQTADDIIRSLSGPVYRAKLGENCNFILKHSVSHMPSGVEIDVPLSYADYYFIEALIRYKKFLNSDPKLK